LTLPRCEGLAEALAPLHPRSRPPRASPRGGRSLELDRAFPGEGFARASRSKMRFDRRMHSKTLESRALVLRRFPARLVRRCSFRRQRSVPSSRSLRLVPTYAASRRDPSRLVEEMGHRTARGRSMQARPGKCAFHDAPFTSAALRRSARRFHPRVNRSNRLWYFCRLLRALACRFAGAKRCERPKAAKTDSAGAS